MKIKFSFLQCLCMIFLFGLLQASPGWASEPSPSIQTAFADSTVTVGDELHISILLDLDGAWSSGGYIDLIYDPAVLECLEVQNNDMFGPSGTSGVEFSDSGTIRTIQVTSRTASNYDVMTFSSIQIYAAVTFRALQPVDSTAVQFVVDTSQIFGTGGGNILTRWDDSTTGHITIEAETAQPPTTTTTTPTTTVPFDEPDPSIAIPEPSTWLLLVLGLGGMLLMRKRKV